MLFVYCIIRIVYLSAELVCGKEVVDLVESLGKLFLNPHCSLKDLSLGNMCAQGHLASLLISCPTLQTLSLEISLGWDRSTTSSVQFTPNMRNASFTDTVILSVSYKMFSIKIPVLLLVHVGVHQVQGGKWLLFSDAELSLEKLTLNAVENQTTVECLPAVLQHAPNLSSLHVTGIQQARSLLRTLPGLTNTA